MSEYWKKQVFNHYDGLERLARKRFPAISTAHQAFLYVIEKLEEDKWRRVRAYKGKSSFQAYLRSVAGNLLEDFSRKEFGRRRPPEWLKTQGVIWTRIYQRLCLERMSVNDVLESLKASSVVEEAIDVILAEIPDCGKQDGKEIAYDEDQDNKPWSPSLHYLTPEQMVTALERVSVLETVRHLLTDTAPPDDNSLRKPVLKLRSQLKLTKEEHLFLKTVYEEGISVSRAGCLLGWNSNQAHGKHRRLLERIRKAFRETGLEDVLKSVLKNGNGVISEIF